MDHPLAFTAVACLDDLLDPAAGPASEFVYDLVRLPIWNAAEIDIAKSPRDGQRHNLAPGFDAAAFVAACGAGARVPTPAAEAMLAAALPAGALVVGAAMPAWLTALLDRAGQAWLSLELAPTDYGSDRWILVRSHDARLRAVLGSVAIPDDAAFMQACLKMAAVRRRRRADAAPGGWDGALVWVGHDGDRPEALAAHAETIAAAAADRTLLHRSPPGRDGAEMRAALSRLTGQDVTEADEDVTELLAMDDDVAFIGLASPALAEAEWFGKPVLSLAPTAEPPLRLAPQALLDTALWRALLCARPDPAAVPAALPLPALRALLADGEAPAAPVAVAPVADESLRRALDIERQRVDDLRLEVEGLKEALRVVLRHATARSVALRSAESSGA